MAKPSKKSTVKGLREQAQFVFRGVVQQRGAATLDQVPLTRGTLIVSVQEILKSPDILKGFEGAEITVQLAAGQTVQSGRSYVFYTNGWLYGAGLAVRCVAVAPESGTELRRVGTMLEAEPARAVHERAKRAELVVEGQVTSVRSVPRRPGTRITEHDPDWREAVVAVASVPQGASASAKKRKEVVIRFAASQDVRWAKAPKFSVGLAGTWMLGDKKEGAALRAAAGAQRNQFVVVDPEDFYPRESSERVLGVLKKR